MSQAQIKAVREFNPPNVHLLKENKKSSEGQPFPANQLRYPCRFCGRRHESKREACPAWGKQCVKCGKENHFARKCPLSSTSNKVSLLEEEDELPVFQVFKVSANQSSDSSLVTLKVRIYRVETSFVSKLIPERVVMFYLYIFTTTRPVIVNSSVLRQPSLPLYPTMAEISQC